MTTDKISGRVMLRKNTWYMILTMKDEKGKPKQKWISTGLSSNHHKREAEALLSKRIYDQPVLTPDINIIKLVEKI